MTILDLNVKSPWGKRTDMLEWYTNYTTNRLPLTLVQPICAQMPVDWSPVQQHTLGPRA